MRRKLLGVSDPFALLGLPRRPLVDQEALREAYFQSARRAHPDAPGGSDAAFAEARAAFDTLRNPASRLEALAGSKASPPPRPPENLFKTSADAIQETRAALASAGSSALERALTAQHCNAALARVGEALRRVTCEEDDCSAVLAQLDANWPQADADALASLASRLRFIGRFRRELEECAFQLRQRLPASGQ
jgi:curved DNA-binding protein CbpA